MRKEGGVCFQRAQPVEQARRCAGQGTCFRAGRLHVPGDRSARALRGQGRRLARGNWHVVSCVRTPSRTEDLPGGTGIEFRPPPGYERRAFSYHSTSRTRIAPCRPGRRVGAEQRSARAKDETTPVDAQLAVLGSAAVMLTSAVHLRRDKTSPRVAGGGVPAGPRHPQRRGSTRAAVAGLRRTTPARDPNHANRTTGAFI